MEIKHNYGQRTPSKLDPSDSRPVLEDLQAVAAHNSLDLYGPHFSTLMDQGDPLRSFRSKFAYPLKRTLPHTSRSLSADQLSDECVYMCGNSLGLKPKSADTFMQAQLDKWGQMGVETHFEEPLPAALCDRSGRVALAALLGAAEDCVVLMNGLTVNLHLLMSTFYRPTDDRYKILIEGHAFPSDRYAMHSQLELRGQCPEEDLIQLTARHGEDNIRTEDIIELLEREGHSISVVCLSGVQYYTGQKFDMAAITKVAHDQGCLVGWDLAHAVGNVKLNLDEWGVDFACWCTYKYLNSGPGCIGGAYVNKRHSNRTPQLRGWWSNKEDTRFLMQEMCDTATGVDGYRLSNPPPFLVALVVASLEIFKEAGMERLLAKQRLLTGYLEALLAKNFPSTGGKHSVRARVITPTNPEHRGCQLSLCFSQSLKTVHQELTKRGVVCDIRLPHVMRLAPVPLYNSYSDVYKFVTILSQVFHDIFSDNKLKEG